MSVYQSIKRGRRTVVVTAAVVYVLVVGLLISAVRSADLGVWQAVALAIAATLPASLALISLDRRPSLLPAAWMAAMVAAVIVIEAAPIWIVVAVVWAHVVRARPRPAPEARWMSIARPLLAASVFLPILLMGMHADPVCTVTSSDGSVESVDPAAHGLSEGWRISLGSSETSSDAESGTQSCRSDTVLWWESALSVVGSFAVLGAALRWPTSEALLSSPVERVGSAV